MCVCVLQDIVQLVVGRLAAGDRTYKASYALRLTHTNLSESYWLHSDLTMYQVRQKYESLYPAEEWRSVYIYILSIYLLCLTVTVSTPSDICIQRQGSSCEAMWN